jgi:hypothetical protein
MHLHLKQLLLQPSVLGLKPSYLAARNCELLREDGQDGA